MNLKEVFQSQEHYSDRLKTLESEIATLRERLKASDEDATSKSQECESLKERLDSTIKQLTLAEEQISGMRQKEINIQEIIDKMKADFEAAAEEERQKNEELKSKLQAALSGNSHVDGKELMTPTCCLLRIPCFRRSKT